MMNTIMQEKIAKAFEEWKQPEPQPKESAMEPIVKYKNLSPMLLDMIEKNPGITGKDLRVFIMQRSPSTPISYVPALLKGLYDAHYVSRTQVDTSTKYGGRTTFAYTRLTDAERKELQDRDNSVVAKPVDKIKKTKPTSNGINALIPTKPTATRPLDVGPTTVHITISTTQGAYSMKLEEAKFIYQQLNQIFGGMR
jgi:hypothetical protein